MESGIAFAMLICTYKVTTHAGLLTDKLFYEAQGYNRVVKMNIVILAGLLVATLVSQSNGAAMIPEHPQTAFCKAEFGKALFYITFIPSDTHASDIGIMPAILNLRVIPLSSLRFKYLKDEQTLNSRFLANLKMFAESEARVQYFVVVMRFFSNQKEPLIPYGLRQRTFYS